MRLQIIELDFIRALAITSIVLCHMHYFIHSNSLDKLSVYPAFFGLSLFFMLSGFLMNHNRKIKSKDEIILFIKKRIGRIYPLYLLAVALNIILDLSNKGFSIVSIKKLEIIFVNVLGLQILFPPEYAQYGPWFVSAIMVYYFIYVFISYYSDDTNDVLINSFILIIPFLILRNEFGLIRTEIFDYYPLFIAGIVAAEVRDFKKMSLISIYSIMIMLLFYLLYYYGIISMRNLHSLAISLIFSLISLFLVICYVIYVHNKKNINVFSKSISAIISKIAYGSYAIYLFHGTILTILMSILYNVRIHNEILYDFSILAIGIPVAFTIGYYIQKVSNKFIT